MYKKVTLFTAFFGLYLASLCSQEIIKKNDYESSKSSRNVDLHILSMNDPDFPGKIKVKATLINNTSDTVYFLSTTCYGRSYSLQFDTSKFIQSPIIVCVVNFPCIDNIPPMDSIQFESRFERRIEVDSITLGFDLFEVKKDFYYQTMKFQKIHNRPQKDRSVIWAQVQPIK